MAQSKTMDARKLINMSGDLVARIRRYRFDHEIDTEAEAIRTLIEKGLEAGAKPEKERRKA